MNRCAAQEHEEGTAETTTKWWIWWIWWILSGGWMSAKAVLSIETRQYHKKSA
jgi:hypothetical protein